MPQGKCFYKMNKICLYNKQACYNVHTVNGISNHYYITCYLGNISRCCLGNRIKNHNENTWLTVYLPLHLLMLRFWYQASMLMRLFGHPSDAPIQALALSVPVTQLGHSLSSALPSMWSSNIALIVTPPFTNFWRMKGQREFGWLINVRHILLLAYGLCQTIIALAT